MAERLLIEVDIDQSTIFTRGIDLKTASFFGAINIVVETGSFQNAKTFLKDHFNDFTIYCNATALECSDAISLLDQGASKIFVTMPQLRAIVEERLLYDLERLLVKNNLGSYDGDSRSLVSDLRRDVETVIGEASNGTITFGTKNQALAGSLDKDGTEKDASGDMLAYTTISLDTWEVYEENVSRGHGLVVPASILTTDPTKEPDLVPAWRVITDVLKSDRPDGLYPTVVNDERGVCLGLVYSNKESIQAALQSGRGVYWSRSRNKLWVKGEESGDVQELINIKWDCDADALQFTVRQKGDGFCHLKTPSCFGSYSGIARLEKTLQERKASAPEGSYTARLFSDPKLLQAKIMEEADELCRAESQEEVAAEAADLLYFAMARCTAAGVSLRDVEKNLDLKSTKVSRRKGDAKPQWAARVAMPNGEQEHKSDGEPAKEMLKEAASVPKAKDQAGTVDEKIQMRRLKTSETDEATLETALQRPSQRSTDQIMSIVNPILQKVRQQGDSAVLEYTHKFEKATSLTSPVLRAPFPESLMQLPPETVQAIDISFENIRRFHAAQKNEKPLQVETMPGVVCSRFSRPIERVGLYVPGGTAVLPSTALMLGVPAMVAGCKTIVIATPPRSDGTITPEIVYVAHKVGAESIVLAGGAQAVAAMAYGTASIAKVDKILGPGNQFVTAAKMIVSNDTTAGVSIDMPAGPSEVLVIADNTANPAFVASDLLSQAEHGTDSQVVLIAVDLDEEQLAAIESELHAQANALPRVDIVRGAINHSVTLVVKDIEEAMQLSNQYAPEHLILQVENAEKVVDLVQNAGSVFIGPWTPESVGDYSAGVNHSLPTYGYAKQYSGVNLSSFTKHITSSNLTKEGLKNVSSAVMQLAKVEELEAHRRAVSIRLDQMEK